MHLNKFYDAAAGPNKIRFFFFLLQYLTNLTDWRNNMCTKLITNEVENSLKNMNIESIVESAPYPMFPLIFCDLCAQKF